MREQAPFPQLVEIDRLKAEIERLRAVIRKHRPPMCRNYPTEATMPSEEESDEWGCDCPHCEMGRALDGEP